ncbi:hypothetical protein D1AOALGA4SA_7561 [Olavius algarvensis Delta 1 endosymbiont]|nr:hypothetical protein D1AOALGA4SA_7561 [Olavius algarvensis Delta 1 endosymbiont]
MPHWSRNSVVYWFSAGSGFGCRVSGVRCQRGRWPQASSQIEKKLFLIYDATVDCGSGLLT